VHHHPLATIFARLTCLSIIKRNEIYKKKKNSQTVKKGVAHAKKSSMKKLQNQRWQPRSGCGGLIMAKFLITTFQVNFDAASSNWESAPKFMLLKVSHYQTITATSGPPPLISQLFSCCFFLHGLHLFFTVSLFCVDHHLRLIVSSCQNSLSKTFFVLYSFLVEMLLH